MATEISIGEMLLACVCGECNGLGWVRTDWVSITGKDMPFIRNVKCDACFRSSGYVLTEAGYAMCAFVELLGGKDKP